MMTAVDDNSGISWPSPDPEKEDYVNTAQGGLDLGFEIQIDELARPDGADIHRTGAIYSLEGAMDGRSWCCRLGNGITTNKWGREARRVASA